MRWVIGVTLLAFGQSALAETVFYCETGNDYSLSANNVIKYERTLFKMKVTDRSVHFNDGDYVPNATFTIFC